ncbi:DUF2971 domain-containing protein [Burkholderia sp. AU38729]|uniref:DUF2971 domain-containing protein n=1 Tax=Burkholderia sp. AU38729 TaxID=2879633 RepID=UPI001CF57ACD|nr:DUF2971 domain-containing protein [Burkholderia sp. AU38729]MCA8064282.1 DUF2971 domain-containing protein [Burkholderia sp. AU38729]
MTTLRRYTNIPSLLHILKNRKLTLLDPKKWDDTNDSAGMELYRRQKNLKSIVALCFATGDETYHHWHVFAGGAGGACIVFNRDKLLATFDQQNVKYREVDYWTLKALDNKKLALDELPFTKRWGYRPEKEFRAIHESAEKKLSFFDVSIPLDAISRITLSPWLPQSIVSTTQDILRGIDGCGNLQVRRSTLTGNKTWKDAFKEAAEKVAGE